MNRFGRRCVGVVLGLAADRLVGEPPTPVHPVAWFGTVMQRVESTIWADRRAPGVTYAVLGAGLGAGAGRVVRSTAVIVALASAGRELRAVATRVGNVTETGDIDAARAELPSLVGRDPSSLDASGISAAVIESVAENSVDAVVAPVFWAVVAGAPGAAAYRAVNTMDAMVGHRNDRYTNFGWAAARLDDVANYVPARLFALLVMAQSPSLAPGILAAIRRDAGDHPSPNAGVAETAVAAAVGRELGGPLRYGDEIENRPTLGTGPRPTPNDIPRAVAICNRAELHLGVAAVGGWLLMQLAPSWRRLAPDGALRALRL